MRVAPRRLGVRQSLLERISSIVSSCRSIENETVFAVVFVRQLSLTGGAVNAIEASQQVSLRTAGIGETIVGPRQLLLRHRAHDIGRDENHQFCLVIDVVAAPKQGAENWQL